jgi:hypothetical protein
MRLLKIKKSLEFLKLTLQFEFLLDIEGKCQWEGMVKEGHRYPEGPSNRFCFLPWMMREA